MCILFKTLHKTSFLIFDVLLRFCPNNKMKIEFQISFNNVHKYIFILLEI